LLRGMLFFSPPLALRLLLALPPLLAAWARPDFEVDEDDREGALGEGDEVEEEEEELRDAIACSLDVWKWGRDIFAPRPSGSRQAACAHHRWCRRLHAGNALPTGNVCSASKPAVGRTECAA
jgi:hypothetical protein